MLSLCSFFVYAQDAKSLSVLDISGRWTKESEGLEATSSGGDSFVYIFKDDMVFHCGEIFEGVILFNITGKYTIEGNLVKIIYFDFSQNNGNSKKAKQLTFKVLSIDKNRMEALVNDYDYEYKIILKRQNS